MKAKEPSSASWTFLNPWLADWTIPLDLMVLKMWVYCSLMG